MNGNFQAPDQDPGLHKRLLLAFLLVFVVMMISQPLLMKYVKQQQGQQQPQQQQPQPGQPQAPQPGQPQAPAAQAQAAPKTAAPVPTAKQIAAQNESETIVENDLYKITFTNRGAQVKSWILKNYKDEKGRQLDLVSATAAPQFGYPLSLWTYDEGLRKKLGDALYVSNLTGQQKAPVALSFEYGDGALSVRKTFTFDHTYQVKVETEVTNNGAPVQAYPAWPAGFGDQTTAAAYAGSRIDSNYAGKLERLEPKKISGGNTIQVPFHWAGPLDQYFAAIFLPDNPDQAALVTLHNALKIPKDLEKPNPSDMLDVPVLGAAAGDRSGHTVERIYVGPKELDILKGVYASPTPSDRNAGLSRGPNLEDLVDFGFFGFIGKVLFLWLKWTYAHWVANWGWSIIILTVIINIALLPLKWTSMKSAIKMQKVAPQIKAIQDKYRKYPMTDPRRAQANQEVSAIYKKEGINPLGGCLPMLLQLPFLWAFYTMLGAAIDLRLAPWFWVHDLSSADPLHILPISIFISMFFLQRMTPTGGMDPVQQKMMSVMMPVILAMISWNLPAGLGLYWVVSNVVMMLQQVWINNTEIGREMKAAAAKRAAKRNK